MSEPHWIKVGTDRGLKFKCSVCGGNCLCASTWSKYISVNKCNYKYCPRCGIEITGQQTRLIYMERMGNSQ